MVNHTHTNPEQKATKALFLSIMGNFGLAIMKGLTGFLGNSYALIADAIESVSDVFSSVLVLFGIRYSTKPPDKKHPYGHGRAEPLVTFMAVGFLLASALLIAYQSIQNMQKPREMPKPYTLILLGIIIITKEVFYRIISKKSHETHSSSLKAD
ncbi:MAG TPA: cation diffusion facilitator family transporter, partial [Bacteroidia bacterium]